MAESDQQVVSGWTWTRDHLDCTPIKAKRVSEGSIEVVEADEALTRMGKGSIRSASVLLDSPLAVLARLEEWKREELKRAQSAVGRAEADLVTLEARRKDLR
jgi:hypothetical protein